jgi:hypothetical protein
VAAVLTVLVCSEIYERQLRQRERTVARIDAQRKVSLTTALRSVVQFTCDQLVLTVYPLGRQVLKRQQLEHEQMSVVMAR